MRQTNYPMRAWPETRRECLEASHIGLSVQCSKCNEKETCAVVARCLVPPGRAAQQQAEAGKEKQTK